MVEKKSDYEYNTARAEAMCDDLRQNVADGIFRKMCGAQNTNVKQDLIKSR